jgi:hypothetical protein
MLFWVTLLAGLLLVTTLVAVAMLRAERRARRHLFRTLEFSEDAIEFLMSRNGDVRSELTLARILPPSPPEPEAAERPVPIPSAEPPALRPRPAIRLVHPIADDTGPADQDAADPQRHRGA